MKKCLLIMVVAAILSGVAGCTTEEEIPMTSSVSPETVVAAKAQRDLNSLDGKKIGHGQGTSVNEKNQPIDMLALQEKYSKYDALYIFPESNKIYLTFDEGYENGYTSKILDTLKEKNCTAVFFVTMDYVKKNPDLIERMKDEGHVIGNHSTTHPSMPDLSIEKAKNEIVELHDYVRDTFEYEMKLFRPPMGEYSERTLALTQDLGYKSMFWSFAYKDWLTDAQPDKETAIKKITGSAHGGAIYLLHAVSSTNAEILGTVIDNLREQGYEVCAYRE
jgi:peptidoglycan-N-acetylmuramic acid deacetylase